MCTVVSYPNDGDFFARASCCSRPGVAFLAAAVRERFVPVSDIDASIAIDATACTHHALNVSIAIDAFLVNFNQPAQVYCGSQTTIL